MPWVRLMLIVGGMVGVTAVAGCNKPLFPNDAPRTPYERYQALRGRQRPLYELDQLGNPQPALRERLEPLDRP